MDTIIFIPGGGGSRLKLQGQEIWPPTPLEFVVGYSRMTSLIDSNVKVAKVIDSILCYDVYKSLQNDLATIAKNLRGDSIDFPYDWRKDILESAKTLAAKISSCVKNGSNSITLVAHSMGNLVARALLESGDFSHESWFPNINKYVGICGPHFGVPRILVGALGHKDFMSVSPPDIKIASADHRYPGFYQCLPFQGRQVIWDVHGGTPHRKDFYNPTTSFGLDSQNLDAAKRLQKKLIGPPPSSVQYFIISGKDQTTDERIEYDGLTYLGTVPDTLGDSVLPLWTAILPQSYHIETPGDHIGVLKTYAFRVILYQILTGGALAPQPRLPDRLGITLSLNSFTYLPNEPIDLLLIPDLGTQLISGTIQISHLTDRLGKRFADKTPIPIEYSGPTIRTIRATISAPGDPGAYRVSFIGSHVTSPETNAAFVVRSPSANRRTLSVPQASKRGGR